MILPFWLTGVRSILKNDRLVIKVRMLLGVEDAFQGMGPREAEQFQYQLQTAPDRDTGKDIPVDVKALLLREDAPESFLGLQMQVSINSVQGADYPYFYCVIVGRPELGLQFAELGGRPSNLVVEPSHENGVDVIVIRQRTTKKSGYETKPRVANEIFRYALEQTRRILDAHAQ
jgi:hypothetical protein